MKKLDLENDYLPVNTGIQVGLQKIFAIENTTPDELSCQVCCFGGQPVLCEYMRTNILGECTGDFRKDGKEVFFVDEATWKQLIKNIKN